MKKLALVLAIMMIFSLIACTKTNETTSAGTTPARTTPDGTESLQTTPVLTQSAPTDAQITGIDENALAIVNEAIAKLKLSTTYKYEMKSKTSLISEFMNLDTDMVISAAVENFGKEGTKIRLITTTTALGMSNTDDMYYENGCEYYTSEDGNYKQVIEDGAEDYDLLGTITSSFDILEKASGNYGASKVVTNEDGTKTVTIILSKEGFINIAKESEDVSEEDIAEMNSMTDFKYDITVTVNSDGLPSKISFDFLTKMPEEGLGTVIDVDFTYTDVKVEAPEGYLDYEDAPEFPDIDIDWGTDFDWEEEE